MYHEVRKFRSFGSIALSLAHFADNRFGAVLNFHAFIWDIAAGLLIVNEAGGKMTDASGKPIELDFQDPSRNYSVIAAHPKNTGAIQRFIT
jgi:fructose-1,6-bisphosphatase/inositol monophosphatase family enzyme